MFMDIRFAIRSLFRAPMFAIAALVTLAVGIGANTIVFSIINTLLLRPLPVEDPSRFGSDLHGLESCLVPELS